MFGTTRTFHAQPSLSSGCFEIHVIERDLATGTRRVAAPVTFVDLDPSTRYTEPTFALQEDEARALMDALWNAGLRPTNVGSAGQLHATEQHLRDMRQIVAGTLAKLGVDVHTPVLHKQESK